MVNSQQDIMTVCLAVVRGVLTPEQAREAILGRTSSDPVLEILRLNPELVRQAGEIHRLPMQERDECLDLFKDLYQQPPKEVVLREDESLARALLQSRLISNGQAEECLRIQKQLLESGVHPLPRLAELLIKKKYLIPGGSEAAFAAESSDPISAFPIAESHDPRAHLPAAVQEAMADPDRRFGRYVRVDLLGQGGSGEVWKSWDVDLERWVALKFLKFEDTEELARLKREAQTSARLSHPGIAQVFEIVEARERTFLVFEYIEGQTLETFPRHDHRQLVVLLRDATLAIHYAHSKGIVHRDLKPGNIMVDASNRVVVTDFGLARQIESKRSIGGLVFGTPAYMSPEQAIGGDVDVRSDVYSLGATLYELFAGRPPFKGASVFETLEKVVGQEPAPLAHIAGDLRTIVSKCLMKEPARRYSSAADLAEDLRRWLEGEAIIAHPPSALYLLRKRAAKWKAALWVAAAGVLVAAGISGWVVPRWLKADRAENLKELELAAEKAERSQIERALALSRPHLDEGRKLQARIDRVLTTETWKPQDIHGLLEQAHREIDRALTLYPNHPETLLEKARLFQYEDNWEAAAEYCTRAIESSHGFATAYLQRARVWLDQCDFMGPAPGLRGKPEGEESRSLAERIRRDLKEVQSWSKDDREVIFAKGALALVGGEYGKAAPLLEEYSKLTLSDFRGWEWTAHAWLHLPDMETRAIDALTEAMKYRPRLPSLLILRGTAHLQRANRLRRELSIEQASSSRAQALKDFRCAREFDPLDPGAHRGLGDVSLQVGEGSLAASHFSQALNVNPRWVPALVGRSRARLRDGDIAGASSDVDQAIALGSTDPKAMVVRGRVRCARQDFGGAISDLNQALSLDSKEAEARVGLGDVRWASGDAVGAMGEYEQAIAIDAAFAEAYHHRGIVERDQGDDKQAALDLTKALTLDPGNALIYYDRGVNAGNRHHWIDALTDFRRGLSRMPSDLAPFWFRMWMARAFQGDLESAQEELAASARDYTDTNPERRTSRIVSLLLGRISVQGFVAELERSPRGGSESAQGYFYAGIRALIEGDRKVAGEFLGRCIGTRAIATGEYWTAVAELKLLRAPH